ncbi:MAG: DNRLRE domain-containing protein, partial [Prosthecobacter sp.]|nr:DNRLRE domain-containing protein [Prosthecobacter sp.]
SLTDNSPSVSAEGAIGDATLGGAGVTSGATAEAGRFIYQSRTGDGVMTAYVPSGVPLQGNAYIAVMVRASTANNTFSAATAVNSNTGTFGSKLAYRTTVGGSTTVTPSTDNNLDTPRWLRLTRTGTTFIGEVSADGTNWVSLGTTTVPSMPATALWGIFHFSNDWAASSTYLGDFQLATFQNITIEDFTTLPGAPTGLTLSYYGGTDVVYDPSFTNLSWGTASLAAGYRIERRGDDGSVDVFDIPSGTTTSYADYNFTLDTAYEYRIRAYNSVGDGGWSTPQHLATTPADRTFSLTTAGAGNADAGVRADTPDAALGTQDSILVSRVTTTSKAYFRFDLNSLPAATFKTATLKLTVLSTEGISGGTFFNGNTSLLNSESSDTWAESGLTWNNAPQNNTAGTGFLAPILALGNLFYFSPPPANGSVVGVGIAPENLIDNKGANNLVTLAISNAAANSSMTFASREHAIAAPPTLEFTYAPLEPLRPGFLTATPGAVSSFDLAWSDNSADETGFQIERRAANGAWTLLATLAADTTGFTDTTALPGVIYEYRLCATGTAGSSSWATGTSLLHSSVATIGNAVWSANSLVFNQADTPPGNGYVPTSFIYYPPVQNFFTSQSLSTTIRNNSDSRLGMKFTIGDNPVVIRELGRWVISGNTGTHTIKLVDAATDADVPGGSVSIATAGAPVGIKYVALTAPITLAANTAYYLVSQETNGGDQWYEGNTSLTYNSTVVTVNNAVYSSGTTYVAAYSANNCYVPLSFRYSLPDQPFTTGHSMTTLRNDYTGWLGMKITTGATSALVSQLGRWVVPGNTGTHTVKLVDSITGTDVASASVATFGALGGQFAYTPLASPVALAANASYYLLSQETAGGDQWYDFSQPAPGTATGYQNWLLANNLPMDASGAGSATATPANDGLPNLIKYALGLAPSVNGNAGRLSYGRTTDTGSDYLTFIYTRPEPTPAGMTYTVEASPDLATWSATGLVEVSSTLNAGLRTITVRDSVPMAAGNRRFLRLMVAQ